MPLYNLVGTPIQFTVTDDAAEAFNRVDILITRIGLDNPSLPLREISVTVILDDLFNWKKVTELIENLRGLSGNYYNQFKGGIEDPRLVKV